MSSDIITSRSLFGVGTGAMTIARMAVYTVVFAPMPIARHATAASCPRRILGERAERVSEHWTLGTKD